MLQGVPQPVFYAQLSDHLPIFAVTECGNVMSFNMLDKAFHKDADHTNNGLQLTESDFTYRTRLTNIVRNLRSTAQKQRELCVIMLQEAPCAGEWAEWFQRELDGQLASLGWNVKLAQSLPGKSTGQRILYKTAAFDSVTPVDGDSLGLSSHQQGRVQAVECAPKGKQPFLLCNAHLKWYGPDEHGRLLPGYHETTDDLATLLAAAQPGCGVLVGGDFNRENTSFPDLQAEIAYKDPARKHPKSTVPANIDMFAYRGMEGDVVAQRLTANSHSGFANGRAGGR